MRRRARLVAAMVAALAVASCGFPRSGAERERGGTVTVYSTTDMAVIGPVIDDFRSLHPKIRVRYVDLDGGPLFERFVREVDGSRPSADIVLSSAMDLQVKLVNDGYAQKHYSRAADSLPAAAKWRSELFGLTFEPVVMVVNRDLLAETEIPRTRFDLVRTLRDRRDFWARRVGTYDIAASNVGYLLAAQDARQSSEFGSLIESLGNARARTYANVSALLDDIASGRVLLGYNVLGSYAKRRIAQGAPLRAVYPEDYTLAIVRAAFISRAAPNPAGAHAFLEYLVSPRGQRVLATRTDLAAVSSPAAGPYASLKGRGVAAGPLRPIPIGPGLLTYLDKQKRERFLANWRTALRTPRQGDDSFEQ